MRREEAQRHDTWILCGGGSSSRPANPLFQHPPSSGHTILLQATPTFQTPSSMPPFFQIIPSSVKQTPTPCQTTTPTCQTNPTYFANKLRPIVNQTPPPCQSNPAQMSNNHTHFQEQLNSGRELGEGKQDEANQREANQREPTTYHQIGLVVNLGWLDYGWIYGRDYGWIYRGDYGWI